MGPMTKYRELAIVLPCHSLEDFPLFHTGDDADSLLAGWTALWHPVLLHAVRAGPKWHRVDLPPEDLQERLLVIPTVSMAQLPAGFVQRAKEAGSVVIRQEKSRPAILKKALDGLDGGDLVVDPELVADFLALGYAFLQIQVLTRQMRYSSNLDEPLFFRRLLEAAQSAVEGRVDESRRQLGTCFDQLAEERDHYYSVDAYIVDLTLIADTTLGSRLRDELSRGYPINLLLAGELATQMAEREPASLAAVRGGIEAGTVGVVGGEFNELPLALVSSEALLAELRRGEVAYEQSLGRRVEVYGRRRFGATPALPAVLEKLKFLGAIHATMEEGWYPQAPQIKTRWQGADAAAIDALAKPPLDASKPETFLSWAQKLGETMDTDHVATLCLAHWPSLASPWYDDLRRCTRFTPALGRLITVERYFSDTYRPGSIEQFAADQYKSPYLKQAVIRRQPDPLGTWTRSWSAQVETMARDGLQTMREVLTGQSVAAGGAGQNDIANGLSATLTRQSHDQAQGILLLNPFSFSRRVGLRTRDLSRPPAVAKPVVAADRQGDEVELVVDLPPMGFAWIGASSTEPAKKKEPLLAEDDRQDSGALRLRNEFMEVAIDPITGALKSIRDYRSRGNRLSQQVAVRLSGGRGGENAGYPADDESLYSVMAADEVRVTRATATCGEILAAGRLLDREGNRLATYQQRFQIWRGSPVLRLEIELSPERELSSDAWNSYYACRFAWADEDATLWGTVQESRHAIRRNRFEAPLYVDIESETLRTTILTGGLPYHRRVGDRMLDSLLIVRGETTRRFQLGIGIDLPQSLAEAISMLAPISQAAGLVPSPRPDHSWLFHLDSRSVVATHWSTLSTDSAESGSTSRVRGVRVRLCESTGRSGRVHLSSYRPFVAGRVVNFRGETLAECSAVDGKLAIDVAAHEWLEVEGTWQ